VLANVTRRDIVPAVKLAKIEWHGWHALRRGVATTLSDLAVPDKTIQRILRHANVAVTQRHYIKTNTAQAKAAMNKLGKAFAKKGTKVVPNRAHLSPNRPGKPTVNPSKYAWWSYGSWTVAPRVAGSNPVAHPNLFNKLVLQPLLLDVR
jgi:hypothetical protein